MAKGFPPAKRVTIMRRDRMTCQLCYEKVRDDVPDGDPRKATLDHIVRRRDGGSNRNENLRLACLRCNLEREGARLGPSRLLAGPYAELIRLRATLPASPQRQVHP